MNNETIQLRNLSIGYQTKHSVRTVAEGINVGVYVGIVTSGTCVGGVSSLSA